MGKIEDILSRPRNEFEEPKNLPDGTYVVKISGQYTTSTRTDDQTGEEIASVSIPMQPQQPTPDVNSDALAEALGEDSLQSRTVFAQFRLDARGKANLRKLIDHCEVPEGESTLEDLAQLPGRQCLATIKTTSSKKEIGRFFTNVNNTAKI